MINRRITLWGIVRRKYESRTHLAFEPIPKPGLGARGYQLYGMPNEVLEDITEEVLDVFTQNHYEQLADLIDRHMTELIHANTGAEQKAVSEFAYEMIKMFQADNPKFKPMMFMERAFHRSNELRTTKEKT